MRDERGIVNLIIIAIGLTLIFFLIGFFRPERSFWDTVNYKALLRLPCGLSLKAPEENSQMVFPIKVKGYVKGCGWDVAEGNAGTAQVFDANGRALTKAVPLSVPSQSDQEPFYFETLVPLVTAPQADTGTFVVVSRSGLVHAFRVRF